MTDVPIANMGVEALSKLKTGPNRSYSHSLGNLLLLNIRCVADKPIKNKIPQLLTEGLVLENRQWLQEHERIMCSHLVKMGQLRKRISWPFTRR